MFLDLALMSLLLVAAHLLRSRVRLLQNLYVPTAFLAGLLGLLGGDQILGAIPFQKDDQGAELIGTYPAMLVVVLFATLFMGYRPKGTGWRAAAVGVSDTFLYNLASELGQYGLALLFGLTVLSWLFPELNPGFALMLPAGFAGGHGTVTVVGGELQHGWEDALSVGFTFATIGLLVGVLGGMALVNLGIRLGYTPRVRTPHDLPPSSRSGFLSPDERQPLGEETVSSMALDPLTWPIALVLTACGVALLVDRAAERFWPALPHMPMFALSMLAGALLQRILNWTGLGPLADRRIIVRIGSAVSDYLIAFGIASIKLPVIRDYAMPLLVMSLFGLIYSAALFWFTAPRVFGNYWFERGIFVYGWNTGVVGTGIMLLRVVDPKLQSRTLEDYGLAYLALAPLEIALLVVLPPLVARQIILAPALVLVAAAAVCILAGRFVVNGSSAGLQVAEMAEGSSNGDPRADLASGGVTSVPGAPADCGLP